MRYLRQNIPGTAQQLLQIQHAPPVSTNDILWTQANSNTSISYIKRSNVRHFEVFTCKKWAKMPLVSIKIQSKTAHRSSTKWIRQYLSYGLLGRQHSTGIPRLYTIKMWATQMCALRNIIPPGHSSHRWEDH
jgi:hypothetical protein